MLDRPVLTAGRVQPILPRRAGTVAPRKSVTGQRSFHFATKWESVCAGLPLARNRQAPPYNDRGITGAETRDRNRIPNTMTPERPNPDELLARVQAAEARGRR